MKRHQIYKWVYFLMLLAIASIGFYKGVLADTGGKDAQWYPAKLFSENIDFYNYCLEHYEEWFMRQVPNYYFQFYYLLKPVSSVSWDSFKLIWFSLNLVLLLFFLIVVKKRFAFGYKEMVLLIFPFFIGLPLILLFTNGQSILLILVLAYLSWHYKENKILLPILLSLLTIKYTFGIPIILGFLLMGYYRSVILSGLITLIFPIVYAIQFDLNFISTIFLPFRVATSAAKTGSGTSDLMSLYELFFDGPLIGMNVLTISLVALFILFSYLSIKYDLDKKTIFLCSILLSLFGFFHLAYDYVIFLLIIPLVYEMKHFKIIYGYLLLFCVAPRLVQILDLISITNIGVRAFLRSEFFVIFNLCSLIGFFFFIIKNDIDLKKNDVEKNILSN